MRLHRLITNYLLKYIFHLKYIPYLFPGRPAAMYKVKSHMWLTFLGCIVAANVHQTDSSELKGGHEHPRKVFKRTIIKKF